MDITLVAPCKDLSGGIKVIAKYGNLLHEHGHNVTVVYPRRRLGLRQSIRQGIKRIVKNEKDHLDRFVGNLLAVDEVTETQVPAGDVIIATAWETAEWVNALSERKGKKVYLIQGHEVWNAPEERVYATYRFLFKKITISQWLKDLVKDISGDEDIDVIPNASDHMIDMVRHGGSSRPFDIGMTYSPIPNKGADIGLTVMKQIKAEFPKARFVVFGSETPEVELPADTVVYTRPDQELISKIYQQTSIWISTSYEEGFCLPCLEAASSGTAIVSTDNKGVRDIITDSVNGYITSPGKPDEIIRRVRALLKDSELLNTMQEKAYRRSKDFSWEISGDRMSNILTKLVGEKAS